MASEREQLEALLKRIEKIESVLGGDKKQDGVSKGFARQLQKNAAERGDEQQVRSIQDFISPSGGEKNEEAVVEAMKRARPGWQQDNLGVRGNPVQFMRQQILNDVPPSTVTRRGTTESDIQRVVDNTLQSRDTSPPGSTGTTPAPNPNPFDPPNPDPEDPIETPPGVHQVLSAHRGQDVGSPNSYSVLYVDAALVYQTPDDTGPTSVTAGDVPQNGTAVIAGVTFARVDRYYTEAEYPDATDISPFVHNDAFMAQGSQPHYRIYLTNL